MIFWYHNGTLLKDGKYPEAGVGGPGGGSGLISSHLTLTPSRTMSMLTLHHIQHIHSGNYTCRAPNAEPDTTQLFVTQRKKAFFQLKYLFLNKQIATFISCFVFWLPRSEKTNNRNCVTFTIRDLRPRRMGSLFAITFFFPHSYWLSVA